jgi:predicted small secreted protein
MGKIALSLGIISLLALTACNTVRGVGRDVQSVGRTVEKTTN